MKTNLRKLVRGIKKSDIPTPTDEDIIVNEPDRVLIIGQTGKL